MFGTKLKIGISSPNLLQISESTLSYYWKALISLAWFSLSALLETLEFTPVFWVLDSHALWHFTTAPLPLLYYSFIIEDSLTLLRGKELENKSRYHFELDIDDDSGGKMK
jgi:hypothetical protein